LSPDTESLIPTVTDNLFSRGIIDANEIGVSFEPTTSREDVNGEITWGTYILVKWTIVLTYVIQVEPTAANSLAKSHTCTTFRVEYLVTTKVLIHPSSPVTSTSPASEHWGIDQSVSYGTTTILSTTAGIVDTGKQNASQTLLVDDSKKFLWPRNHPHPSCLGWI